MYQHFPIVWLALTSLSTWWRVWPRQKLFIECVWSEWAASDQEGYRVKCSIIDYFVSVTTFVPLYHWSMMCPGGAVHRVYLFGIYVSEAAYFKVAASAAQPFFLNLRFEIKIWSLSNGKLHISPEIRASDVETTESALGCYVCVTLL